MIPTPSSTVSSPSSLGLACCVLSASALFLGGMLAQNLFAPAPAQAATVSSSGGVTMATAKIQNGEDALFVLTDDTLSVYRTNVGNKKMERILSTKLGNEASGAKHDRVR